MDVAWDARHYSGSQNFMHFEVAQIESVLWQPAVSARVVSSETVRAALLRLDIFIPNTSGKSFGANEHGSSEKPNTRTRRQFFGASCPTTTTNARRDSNVPSIPVCLDQPGASDPSGVKWLCGFVMRSLTAGFDFFTFRMTEVFLALHAACS